MSKGYKVVKEKALAFYKKEINYLVVFKRMTEVQQGSKSFQELFEEVVEAVYRCGMEGETADRMVGFQFVRALNSASIR
ncbi:hypothetical protein Ciccas_004603 [Cichlidogyrus casuarinus]|uniref:Uncharacterized protein n=1 Tax=Cichlidogyrus casuarinus TaxID=1844966 RepID=A0ABD2QB41_9PLAT